MGSDSKNGVGVPQVPQVMKNVIQNLKEIVKCSDTEIYAVLKECNMDPNEAVQRLLSQGCYAFCFSFLFSLFIIVVFIFNGVFDFREK